MSREVKILIADDDNFIRLSLKTVLEQQGYSVIEAHDGEDAVKKFSQESPDLILLDGIMPKMDGFEACKAIRGHEKGLGVPIIIVTGLDKDNAKVQHKNAQVTGYLEKPIDWKQLTQKISQFI